jgi:hypothetical protein
MNQSKNSQLLSTCFTTLISVEALDGCIKSKIMSKGNLGVEEFCDFSKRSLTSMLQGKVVEPKKGPKNESPKRFPLSPKLTSPIKDPLSLKLSKDSPPVGYYSPNFFIGKR